MKYFEPCLEPAAEKVVEVAAAVICRADGQFLLAQRPQGRPYPGYWEFPGGKIEAGETPARALVRELQEELGMQVRRASPWMTRIHRYSHATVRLHFFRVTEWAGEPLCLEQQSIAWQSIETLSVSPLLPANGPILDALGLSPIYAISNAAELGAKAFLVRLERALKAGLRLFQLREKTLAKREYDTVLASAVDLAHTYGARMTINSAVNSDDVRRAREVGADGIHLTARALLAARVRPEIALVGGSCHDERELDQAASLGLDFVVLGPVLPTLSHPGTATLGWKRFSELIKHYSLPVYAIGGMRPADLRTAQHHGAHGISMMRAAW
jgi:8-oxo-dGTP diphosphatase